MSKYWTLKAVVLTSAFCFFGLSLQGEKGLAAEGESPFAIPSTNEGLSGEGPIRRYEWFQNLWESR